MFNGETQKGQQDTWFEDEEFWASNWDLDILLNVSGNGMFDCIKNIKKEIEKK